MTLDAATGKKKLRRNAGNTTMSIYALLKKLNSNGGSIVSAKSCSFGQVNHAKQTGNAWTDGEGMSFVYLPPGSTNASTSRVGFGSGLHRPSDREAPGQ